MGGLLALWAVSQIWQPTPAESWLIECPTNLDILVESQGHRLARGDDYLACPVWPEEVPETALRWDRTQHRCCSVCEGTWENLCDLAQADAPEFAEACWTSCAEVHINGKAGGATVDWPHLCCAECGAVRSARCTVDSARDPEEVDACFANCAKNRPESEPRTCWWDLGFEPGVALRGRYEVTLTETGFTARCEIRRSSGEVLEFEQLGKRGSPP
jgi:hypothetical protein